jgi:hypothetical protein
MSLRSGYVYKVLLFLDLFACAVIFRDPDVTISAETGLALKRPNPPRWARVLGWILDHIQANHCALAVDDDIARARAAIAYLSAKQS